MSWYHVILGIAGFNFVMWCTFFMCGAITNKRNVRNGLIAMVFFPLSIYNLVRNLYDDYKKLPEDEPDTKINKVVKVVPDTDLD